MPSNLYQEKTKSIPGLTTTAKTRPLMIDALYDYISQYPEIVKSRRLAMELVGLISKPSGRIEADSGCHDDLALSAAMAFYVRKYDPPLLLNASTLNDSAFTDIIKLNEVGLAGNMNNERLIQDIRDNIDNNKLDSYIDILSLYNKKD